MSKILLFLNLISILFIGILLLNDTWWSLVFAWIVASFVILTNQSLLLKKERLQELKGEEK